jgi:hypothetical protein
MIEQILNVTLVSASMTFIWSSSEHWAEVLGVSTSNSSSSSNLISFILKYHFHVSIFLALEIGEMLKVPLPCSHRKKPTKSTCNYFKLTFVLVINVIHV